MSFLSRDYSLEETRAVRIFVLSWEYFQLYLFYRHMFYTTLIAQYISDLLTNEYLFQPPSPGAFVFVFCT